ncbi:MAG TPA: MauE/DoxX family redox-associated membrane protein [Chryseolinea sp.]
MKSIIPGHERQSTDLFTRVVAFSFLVGIGLSFKLWVSDRQFPLAPAHSFFLSVLQPIDGLLLIVLIGSLIALLFTKKQWVVGSMLTSLVLLVAEDQMRLQPWVYLYFLIFLPFALSRHAMDEGFLSRYLQWIFVACYLWSGVHKINPNFIDKTFQDVVGHLFSVAIPERYKIFGYVIPLVEITIAFLLIFIKTRRAGVVAALGTHLFILLYLSPLGIDGNYVVYPWNVAMMAGLVLLFWRNEETLFAFPKAMMWRTLQLGSFVLLFVMPLLNLVGRWDHYLSFSLYAGKTHHLFIAIEETEAKKLNGLYDNYVVTLPGVSGGRIIGADQWSMMELHVPVYPETRIFNSISRQFCRHDIPEGKMVFMECQLPLSRNALRTFGCDLIRHPNYTKP